MKSGRRAVDGRAKRLAQAIDRVQRDVDKVEFWACAFGGMVQPIPDYEIEGAKLLGSQAPPHTRIGIST